MRVLVSMCLLGVNCRYNGEPKAEQAVAELLGRNDITLIPVCPEQLGGLPTPRTPSECRGESVISVDEEERTEAFLQGARETLRIAKLYSCGAALLKERSPSCGSREIYDGSFNGRRIPGEGVTARLLRESGIRVFNENEIEKLRLWCEKECV